MTRIMVTGSRRFSDPTGITTSISTALVLLDAATHSAVLVHGDAPGADTIAATQAQALGLTIEAHPANWSRYGRAAGPRRNREMIAAGADAVLAFPDKQLTTRANGTAIGSGTWHCALTAREAGLAVLVYWHTTLFGFGAAGIRLLGQRQRQLL